MPAQKGCTTQKIQNTIQNSLSFPGDQKVSSLTGTAGVIIPAISIILPTIIGASQTDYNPVKQTISELVYYPQGWLESVNFCILGVWLLLLSFKFYFGFTGKTTTKVAAGLMAAISLGFLALAICPTNIMGRELTMAGLIHEKTAQMICACFPIICILLVPDFKTDKTWKKLTMFSTVIAGTGLILAVTGGLVMITSAPYLGLVERLIFFNAAIWLIIISLNFVIRGFIKVDVCPCTNIAMKLAHQING